MKRLLIALALLALAAPAAAAPVVRGEPAVTLKSQAPARLRLAPGSARHTALPDIAAQALAEVRETNRRAAAARAFESTPRRVMIGVAHGAAGRGLPAAGQLAWRPVPGGFAAQAAVTSPRAESVRLAIALAGVPLEVEMVFHGSADPTRLEGPVRVGDIADRIAPWWGPITEGETQTVEFFVPAGHAPRELPLAIADASHLLTTPASGFAKRAEEIGAAGRCNVQVPCSRLASDPAFRRAAESVAQMVFYESGMYLCTGTLLNDADPASQVPYFFSANHCFDNTNPPYKTAAQMQSVANTLTTLWGFEAAACNSSSPRSSWTQRSGGATYLHSSPQTDALLLRLNDAPPAGAWFTGWDANTLGAGTAAITIHHPQGDLKMVTEGSVRRLSAPPGGVGGGTLPFVEMTWSSATTEQGRSGAGLWTASGGEYLLRGGLWGGRASCDAPGLEDWYSRFDVVYPEISRHLGAPGGGIDYTDLWWNPSESGWGLNLIQHPSRTIFGVWYTYAPDGKRTWFVMPEGQWTSAGTYTGPVYYAAGPNYTASFDATKVRRTPVGSATLQFSDANNATFSYTVNGVGGSRYITRQPF